MNQSPINNLSCWQPESEVLFQRRYVLQFLDFFSCCSSVSLTVGSLVNCLHNRGYHTREGRFCFFPEDCEKILNSSQECMIFFIGFAWKFNFKICFTKSSQRSLHLFSPASRLGFIVTLYHSHFKLAPNLDYLPELRCPASLVFCFLLCLFVCLFFNANCL